MPFTQNAHDSLPVLSFFFDVWRLAVKSGAWILLTNKFSALIKRNSLYVATIFGGAFAFQAFFDSAITRWYEQHNKGKLWKDVKPRFLEGGDDEDEEE